MTKKELHENLTLAISLLPRELKFTTRSERNVMATLNYYSLKNDDTFTAPQAQIAIDSMCSERTVRRCLETLKYKGYIEVVQKGSSYKHKSTEYKSKISSRTKTTEVKDNQSLTKEMTAYDTNIVGQSKLNNLNMRQLQRFCPPNNNININNNINQSTMVYTTKDNSNYSSIEIKENKQSNNIVSMTKENQRPMEATKDCTLKLNNDYSKVHLYCKVCTKKEDKKPRQFYCIQFNGEALVSSMLLVAKANGWSKERMTELSKKFRGFKNLADHYAENGLPFKFGNKGVGKLQVGQYLLIDSTHSWVEVVKTDKDLKEKFNVIWCNFDMGVYVIPTDECAFANCRGLYSA